MRRVIVVYVAQIQCDPEFLFILYLYSLAEDRYANTRWVTGKPCTWAPPHATNTSLTGMGFKKQRGKSRQHVTLGVSTDCCTQKAHASPTCSPWIDQPLGRWSPNWLIMQAQRPPSAFSGKTSWCQAKWPMPQGQPTSEERWTLVEQKKTEED